MAVNKVEVDGETKLDLTADTVTPETLLKGATAHNAAGIAIVGSIIMPTYTLVVKTSPSASITVTKGTKTFSGTADASGECTFSLPEAGVWTVTVGTKTRTVIVGTQELSITLGFDPVFANNTWDDIAMACNDGSVPDTWAVESQKTMTIGGADYTVDIIGKNHDTYADGGTAPLTFQLHDCYATGYPMNSSDSNVGGWKNSEMRLTYLPAILSLMPVEVRNGIRAVKKLASAGSGSSTLETVSDKLFLPCIEEIVGSARNSVAGEGTQYTYYEQGGSKIKNKDGAATYWWSRSAYASDNELFCIISSAGKPTIHYPSRAFGVAFGFCF